MYVPARLSIIDYFPSCTIQHLFFQKKKALQIRQNSVSAADIQMGKTVSAAIIQTFLNCLHAAVLKYKQYRSVCAAAPKIQASYNYMCMSEKIQDKNCMCSYGKMQTRQIVYVQLC